MHYDGSSWSTQPSGTGYDLLSVWGTSATDVFAVGVAATILHYDGTWAPEVSPYPFGFAAAWGLPPGYGYALSSHSFVVIEYDGFDWYYQTPPETDGLSGIWANSLSAVFVVAFDGAIGIFDGDDWYGGSGWVQSLSDVWGAASNDVFAVGFSGDIFHLRGSR